MKEKYDLIVLGGGSAGLVAAGGAAILGAKVALIEKNLLGGDCLYTGCVPSKTLIRSARFASNLRNADIYGFQPQEVRFAGDSFASITTRVQNVIKVIEEHDAPKVFEEMGVEVIFGTPAFLDPNEIEVELKKTGEKIRLQGKRFCISTGSRPFVPPIEGLEAAGYITNEEVFSLKELPGRLVVLGGGPIGLELGQAFARFGSKVTVIEMADRLLSKEDLEVSRLIDKSLKDEGVSVLTQHKAVRISRADDGSKIVIAKADERTVEIKANEILVAAGRRPNIDGLELGKAGVLFDQQRIRTNDYLQTSARHIYAAGDITGHFQFTHMADYEAQIVIQNSFVPWPFKKKTDFRVVPWTTFTDPEVANVGMTESDALEEFGDSVKAYKVEFEANDRAQAESSTSGFAKVVTRKGRIIGATVVGESAGDLIHEFVWAVKNRMKVADLNQIIRVYPTLSKITQAIGTEATLETLRSPFTQRWFRRYLRLWR